MQGEKIEREIDIYRKKNRERKDTRREKMQTEIYTEGEKEKNTKREREKNMETERERKIQRERKKI